MNDRDALYVGWVLGTAMRNGVGARPVLDDDGNYTGRIEVELQAEPNRLGEPTVRLILVVPEPPEGWVLS